MDDPDVLRASLTQFTGTAHHWRSALSPWLLYTDGMKHFADNAGSGAYWLIDLVGIRTRRVARLHSFLAVRLAVAAGRAVLTVTHGNGVPLVPAHRVTATDCPAGVWEFFVVANGGGDRVLMLPSEY